MGVLPAGKLPPALLARLLASLPISDPALLVGPGVGEDVAVIDLHQEADTVLVAKSDPITFATDAIGFYAVNICANDLAVSGALPRFYIPTLLLPARVADVALAERIFAEIGDACRALDIVVAGGHSEVTHAVNQPIIAGSMLGVAPRKGYVHSGGCKAGNVILLAGEAPIEGISLIARERRAELLARGWQRAEVDCAANYLYTPGISVLKPARAAALAGLVTAMHDPTEGGVVTGLAEMAYASRLGMQIALDAIPIAEMGERLCAEFGLDPLGTIASGALLAACAPENVQALLDTWQNVGWRGTVIGVVQEAQYGLVATRNGAVVPFPSFATDEITRLWV